MKNMYKQSFKDLVANAESKTNVFYSTIENENCPNPYYIGFGNPNARILIFGKEKAFNVSDLKKLEYENIKNPIEWGYYIKNNIKINKAKFYQSLNYINAFYPYFENNKPGHTWSKYHSFLSKIYPEISKKENEFFKYAFLSEINFQPSSLSIIKQFKNEERIKFLKSEFFKSFDVVILACGKYLNKKQIEEIFNVTYSESILKPRENIHIYKNSNQILINTRQLSMDVSNDLLNKIAALTIKQLE